MDCMRINCAHDDSAAWARMVAHLRAAEAVVAGAVGFAPLDWDAFATLGAASVARPQSVSG